MTRLFTLQPEVAGGWGEGTVVVNQAQVESGEALYPEITVLEYQFEGWLGDELLESFPCFVVTQTLANDLAAAGFSGLEFADVTCTTSELFRELYPDRELPPFRRLLPAGRVELDEDGCVVSWTGHDLALTQNAMLVVTEPVLEFLRDRIPHCDVEALVWQGGAED